MRELRPTKKPAWLAGWQWGAAERVDRDAGVLGVTTGANSTPQLRAWAWRSERNATLGQPAAQWAERLTVGLLRTCLPPNPLRRRPCFKRSSSTGQLELHTAAPS